MQRSGMSIQLQPISVNLYRLNTKTTPNPVAEALKLRGWHDGLRISEFSDIQRIMSIHFLSQTQRDPYKL